MCLYLESLEFWQGNSLAALKLRDFWFDHAAPSPIPSMILVSDSLN